uniref:Uncharacterized protein n=1 Tax=viral metagenome TaxID=1070528 RepID=A0A6C0HTG4_9ZZZZ
MNTNQLTESINARILDRNIQQGPPPLLSFYPKSTRYVENQVVDPSIISKEALNKKEWNGYSVNIESELHNQIFQLNSSNKNVYVPSSNSDLYNYPSVSNYSFVNQPQHKMKHEHIFNNVSRMLE